MNHQRQIGNQVIALMLFTTLMLPTVVQSFHLFDVHKHASCNEQSTHFHESISKCELCAVHFTSINYDIAKYPNLLLPKIFVKVNVIFDALLLHSFKKSNTQLRAPPIFS